MVKRTLLVLALLFFVLVAGAFLKIQFIGKDLDPAAFSSYQFRPDSARHGIRLSFLGTSCFILEHQGKQLVMDPFFSNPNLVSATLDHIPYPSLSPLLDSNRYHNVSLITVSHGHYDHCLDIREFLEAGRTTTVIADRGIINQLQPVWQARTDIREADATDWINASDSSFRAYPLPSTHSPHIANITFSSGNYPEPLRELPAKLWNWKLCACNSYLIDVLEGGQTVYRVLMCTGNMDPGAKTKLASLCAERPADIMLPIFWKRSQCWDNLVELNRIARPSQVVLHHWNNFFRSNGKPLQYLKLSELPEVLEELNRDGVPARILLPFQTAEI